MDNRIDKLGIYNPSIWMPQLCFERKTARVDKVVYNDPATVVIWEDGTKTVVKCHEGDRYDPEKGFLLCCAKKLFGNKGRYNDVMREHVPEGGVRIGTVTITADEIDVRRLSDSVRKLTLESVGNALLEEARK